MEAAPRHLRPSPAELLRRSVLDLADGEGSATVLVGSPAVSGELIAAAELSAAGAGCRVIAVAARPGPPVPFAAMRAALGPVLAGRSADDPVFAGAGRLVREVLDSARLPRGGGDRAAQFAHGFAWLLDELAIDVPLLVTADCADALDVASFRALAATARRAGGSPLAVVAALTAAPAADERRTALSTAGAAVVDLPAVSPAAPHVPAARDAAPDDDPLAVAAALLPVAPEGSAHVAELLAHGAERAEALGAPELAIALWRRAADEGAGPLHARLLALGEALDRAGDAEADGVLADAERIAAAAGDDGSLAAARVARARLRAGRGRPADAVALLREALADATADDQRELLEIELARHGRVVLEDRAESLAIVRRLLAAPGDHGPAARRLFAESALEAVSRVEPGREAVVTVAHAALDDGRLLAEETVDGLGWFWAAYALHLAEENGAALAVLDDAVADAQRRGSLAGFVQAIALRSGPRFHLGDLRGAAADCEIALAAGAGVHEAWLPAVRSTLMQLRTHLGDLPGAGRVAAEQELADRATGPTMLFRYGRAVLHAAGGDDEAALTDLRAAGAQMELGGGDNPAMMPWRALAAVLLARRGAHDEAAALAADELRLARRFGAAGPVAIAEHAVAMAITDPAERAERLRVAAATHASGERFCERIETLVDLGAALQTAGAPRDARPILREALDLAHRAGAQGLAERARAALIAAGGRPRRAATRGRDALTPSEMRVAELAVSGRTNREIAQELFVTVKTVEWHLTCCYRKLGVRGRPALAAALRSAGGSTAAS